MGEMKISRFTDSTEISYKKKHAQFFCGIYEHVQGIWKVLRVVFLEGDKTLRKKPSSISLRFLQIYNGIKEIPDYFSGGLCYPQKKRLST